MELLELACMGVSLTVLFRIGKPRVAKDQQFRTCQCTIIVLQLCYVCLLSMHEAMV